ncbi:MAG: hypothetical protein SGJ27_07885 [Candidatus Melainabacteria bacterium]|nr:hypothetical protein [Candidatus Melainabacteria bacterium]
MPDEQHPGTPEERLAAIENRLRAIDEVLDQFKQRNLRVEANKAWEGSKTRIVLICAITYTVASGVFYSLGSHRYFLDAIVPTLGFLLSSQSIPLAKKLWIRHCFQK